MKTVTVGKNDAGQRLDRFLRKTFPNLPSSLIHKSIRKKDITLNKKRTSPDTRIVEGDIIKLFLRSDFSDDSDYSKVSKFRTPDLGFMSITDPNLNIIYEDENLLLLDKPPGILCHSSKPNELNTLITHVQAYLYRKGDYSPEEENSFSPALCNRIDRNTGGIVIAAKNAETLRTINRLLRNGEIDKLYLCLVYGHPDPPSGVLKGYITRDRDKRMVTVHDEKMPESKYSKTEYTTLKSNGRMSLLECRLLTGRTHQIRSMMLAAGHPIVGDRKYGLGSKEDRSFKHQALYSYKIRFDFETDAGKLNYLNHRSFEVDSVPFETLI
ncbi:MAG: RluA family pseudouridine synthase [Eubacteriales bacterium]